MRKRLSAFTTAAAVLLPGHAFAQFKRYPLESAGAIVLHNVIAEPLTFKGEKGLRVTMSDETLRRLPSMTPEARDQLEQLVVVEGTDFSNGVPPGPDRCATARPRSLDAGHTAEREPARRVAIEHIAAPSRSRHARG